MLPTQPETIASDGTKELRWWASTRSNGQYALLSTVLQQKLGVNWALVGDAVMAVGLFDGGRRLVTVTFPHTADFVKNVRDNADDILKKLAHAQSTATPFKDEQSSLYP